MKNINFLLILASLIGMTVFSSCDDDPSVSDISRVTYFPNFFKGEEPFSGEEIIVPCKSSLEIPPITAQENGVEITATTDVQGVFTGNDVFDINVADKYVMTTSAVNADGYPGQVSRTIWVVCTGDLVNSIEGLYTATVVRNGVVSAQYTNMKYVMIRHLGGNEYEISDAIGGYYDIGRQYGDAYRAAGMTITANSISGNDFSFGGPVAVGAFGGSAEMTDFSVDPATKTINFTTVWDAGFTFVVTLNQVQI